jgi:hypothetical protein
VPWPKGRPLDDVFCFKYRRVVANDHTVRLRAHVIDIPPQPQRLNLAKVEVELRESFDGRLQVHYQGSCLAKTLVSAPPSSYRVDFHSLARSHDPRPTLPDAIPVRPGRKPPPVPSPDSPWRKFAFGRSR